ncbi:hypothetical protein HYT25_00535 [Candidatus Pacearchaeota archaeon]|nr:hypothetical protein [Candidatus Pacearchaeota archaeon]
MKKGRKEVKKKKRKIEKKAEKHKVDLKKIKIPLEEKNLEEEILETEEEISDFGFREFLQPTRRAPVLERVAVAQNPELEQQLANVRFQPRGNEEEKGIKYSDNKSEYLATPTAERKRDTFKYSEKTAYSEKQKEDENRTARQKVRSEWKTDEREERWQTEGQKSIEEPPEKKYLEKGQY